ncbi:hypothetical protein DEU56DRAFT_688743, partial [Suillus clintonianus]|uniref:uncharacterized protein n=1 Tax=Suillus clintonianus TaxID=1904413 RepID=UPI001B877FC1
MMLPKGIPTLQSTATKNWTRPDNVFCTEHTEPYFITCNTNPALRGPATDHVPIISILELEIPRVDVEPVSNFKEVDWEAFNKLLETELAKLPPVQPLVTNDEFQRAARDLTNTIQRVIIEKVPRSRPNPHSKRWWSRELTLMRREVAKLANLSYRTR